MRGKGITTRLLFPVLRITPAYAGKSVSAESKRTGHKDHPRVCGEKDSNNELTLYPPGSPPRMRGKGPKGARP